MHHDNAAQKAEDGNNLKENQCGQIMPTMLMDLQKPEEFENLRCKKCTSNNAKSKKSEVKPGFSPLWSKSGKRYDIYTVGTSVCSAF